jgi:signal transduction histidine kinase
MLRSGRLVGVLEVLNRRSGSFTSADEANLTVLAGEAAIVIENAQLHQEKLQAERLAAVGRTVSELAHCMKNILNGIQGGAYVLDLGLTKDDRGKLEKGWDMVKRNTTFLSNLVLDMLAYAKDREPHYEETDVNGLIGTVVDILAPEGATRGIQVTGEVDRALGAVRIDPTGIYRVLLNLSTNAVEACAANTGRVQVRSRQDAEGWFTLEVEDNGGGIAPEDQGKLFTEFFSTKGAKGTGLGLAVAGKVVREHGGRIDVFSQPGKGTRFIIRLPVGGSTKAS